MDKININTATSKELITLDGVGEALAKKIIKHRRKNGRFKKVDGLSKVSGFSTRLVKKNKKRLFLINKGAKSKSSKATETTRTVVTNTKKFKVTRSKKSAKDKEKKSKPKTDSADQIIDWIGSKLNSYLKKEEPAPKKKKFKVTRGKKQVVIKRGKPKIASSKQKAKLPEVSKKVVGKLLTADQINKAAKSIDVHPAAIRAVVEVESSGGGFLKNGKPKILFEGHIFWTQLQAKGISPSKYKKGNEDILYPNWTRKHYKGGNAEYKRLNKALQINRQAALASASWGMFQVMGFNYFVTEYKDVEAFVKAQYKSEYEHLKAFLGYVERNRLTGHLKARNWAKFASGYNGKDYKKNRYDEKLKAAYKRWC